MDALLLTLFTVALAAVVILWLKVREHGRAHVWNRLAARCKANGDAAALREARDARYVAKWAPAKENVEARKAFSEAEVRG